MMSSSQNYLLANKIQRAIHDRKKALDQIEIERNQVNGTNEAYIDSRAAKGIYQ